MRTFRLVPVFLFVLLLGGQSLLLSDEAYSQDCTGVMCCDVPWCYWWPCTYCWGAHPCCAGYVTDDSDPLPLKTPPNQGALGRNDEREPIPAAIAKLDVGDRLMKRMGGAGCIRSKFARRLLGKAVEGLKFESFRFDEKAFYAMALPFQIVADAGK